MMTYRGGSTLAKSRNSSRAYSYTSMRAHSAAGSAHARNDSKANLISKNGSIDMYAQSEKGGNQWMGGKATSENWIIPNKISNQSTNMDNTLNEQLNSRKPSHQIDIMIPHP